MLFWKVKQKVLQKHPHHHHLNLRWQCQCCQHSQKLNLSNFLQMDNFWPWARITICKLFATIQLIFEIVKVGNTAAWWWWLLCVWWIFPLWSDGDFCYLQASASLLLTTLEKDKELLRIFLKVSQMENSMLRRMNLSSFLMVSWTWK